MVILNLWFMRMLCATFPKVRWQWSASNVLMSGTHLCSLWVRWVHPKTLRVRWRCTCSVCCVNVDDQYTSGQMGGVVSVVWTLMTSTPEVRWEVSSVCCANVVNQYTSGQMGGVVSVVWTLMMSAPRVRWEVHGVCGVDVNNQYTSGQMGGVQCVLCER